MKEEFDGNELQLLGLYAKANNNTKLYEKCCTMMYQKLRKVVLLEQIYGTLYLDFKKRCNVHFETEDALNRAASIYAVKNTQKEWKRQYDKKRSGTN